MGKSKQVKVGGGSKISPLPSPPPAPATSDNETALLIFNFLQQIVREANKLLKYL